MDTNISQNINLSFDKVMSHMGTYNIQCSREHRHDRQTTPSVQSMLVLHEHIEKKCGADFWGLPIEMKTKYIYS